MKLKIDFQNYFSNFNFCIDICSELDMYMTDEIVDDIIPEENILISLLDLLLSNK